MAIIARPLALWIIWLAFAFNQHNTVSCKINDHHTATISKYLYPDVSKGDYSFVNGSIIGRHYRYDITTLSLWRKHKKARFSSQFSSIRCSFQHAIVLK